MFDHYSSVERGFGSAKKLLAIMMGGSKRAADKNYSNAKKDCFITVEAYIKMAERTGLEPATSGVTGQHSNQLNYRSAT